jgi:hypothetical protein
MNRFFKALAFLCSFIICTTIQTISTQAEAEVIFAKISNPTQIIHAQDINEIVDYVCRNYYSFDYRASDYTTRQKFCTLMLDSSVMQKVIQTITTESALIDQNNLKNLIYLCPHATKLLTDAITSSFIAINDSLIQVLISNNYTQDSLNNIATYLSKHISTVESTTIQTLVWRNSHAILPLLKAALEQQTPSLALVNYLLILATQYNVTIPAQYSKESIKKRIIEFFKNAPIKADTKTLAMIVVYKQMFGNMPTTRLPYIAPTLKHAITNASILAASPTFTTYTTHQRDEQLIDAIMSKEQELDTKGYYTFIHAQRWQFRLVEQWFTKLWEVRNKRTVSDFIFAHCEKPCQTKKELDQEIKLRQQILAQGGESHREKLLFLNYAFFGNEGLSGSSSAHYLLNNFSALDIKVSLQDIFSMLDYQDHYNAYRTELESLEEEHKKLTSHGHLLLVGVPKAKLKDYIYLSGSGGIQKSAYINGKITNDIQLIMHTLRHYPEKIADSNIIQFCLVLTGDTLTPDSGIKVYSYDLADPVQLAAFDKKSDELFAHIKQDIENGKL